MDNWTLKAWVEWFKGENQLRKLPEKSESQLVSESLLHELECAIKETDDRNWAREQEERKRNQKLVDYSWLIDPSRMQKRPYEIMPSERMEIESLCWQILPTECNKVIMQFREYLSREPAVHEIPLLFRACLAQTIQSRPNPEPESVIFGIDKVKRSNKVVPFSKSSIDVRRNSQEMQMRMPIKFSTLDVRTLPV